MGPGSTQEASPSAAGAGVLTVDDTFIEVHAWQLSGQQVELTLPATSTVRQLRQALASHADVSCEAAHLQLLLGCAALADAQRLGALAQGGPSGAARLELQLMRRPGRRFEACPISEDHEAVYKFLLAGDPKVGKSSIYYRFTRNQFREQPRTAFLEFGVAGLQADDGRIVRLQVWDPSGRAAMRACRPDALLVVFDITDKRSFEQIPAWLDDLEMETGAAACLIGTKLDLADRRQVPREEAEALARSRGLEYFELSAKSAEGVAAPFHHLTDLVLVERERAAAAAAAAEREAAPLPE